MNLWPDRANTFFFNCLLISWISVGDSKKNDHHEHLKSQDQFNCPPSCVCNKTTINCTTGHFDSTDVFLQITDKFYPNLDTLTITGNKLHTIESVDLFGPGVRHDYLTYLDLSNNKIRNLNAHAFEETLPRVEILKLSHNNIRNITGDLFGDLTRLTELWLDNAFDSSLDQRQTAGLIHRLFIESRNKFPHLATLHLEENGLSYLPSPNLFCAMPALQKIYLNGNRLVNFRAKLKCLTNVQHLDLSGNNVTFFDSDSTEIFDSMERLLSLDLSDNPYNCDCYMSPFLKWYQSDVSKEDRVIINEHKTTCFMADPAEFEASNLDKVHPDKLLCPNSEKPYLHTVYIFIALALVGLCLVLACLIYQNKGPFMRVVKGGTKYETVAGYSRLGREPEVTAEFV